MNFLIALLTPILKWLITTGLTDVEGWLSQWIAGQKQKTVDQANLKDLQNARALGDQAAIDKAGQNLLNGVRPS